MKVDRVTEPTRELPALAVWRDGDHERGVDAASVLRHVMSLPPAGDAWIVRAGSAIGEKIGVTRKTR